MRLLLNCVFLVLCNKLDCYAHADGKEDGLLTDPYLEVIQFYNIPSERNFTVEVLEQLIHDFAGRIHCDEGAQDHGEDTEACPDKFCIHVSSVLASLNEGNITNITKETFEKISVILLEIAVGFNESCHSEIILREDGFEAYKNALKNSFTGDNGTGGLQLVAIQQSLELIVLDEPHSHNEEVEPHNEDGEPHSHNEDGEPHSHNEEVEPHNEDAEPHSHNEEAETSAVDEGHKQDNTLIFKEKCLGADIVFDQLGLALDGNVSLDHIGKIAGLVVYHILKGAEISRDCRALPREDFFFKELVHIYGNKNNTLGTKGFTKVMDALQIGDAHAPVETTDDDHGHDHRRKRSVEEADMDFKTSWENVCYTDEQLLAIFHGHDSNIPEEKFNVMCPALIQQKLAGVCVQSEQESKQQGAQPSKLERYGYGSLATIIVCLCSVVGAFVVKFSSDKAYDIIMALFLGLAVGTLFTDAMIHLLPMALGIHGHSETDDHGNGGEDHGHGEGDIVVEEYVWFSLVACAGLYFFYLFEKILILVRRQNVHSHGRNMTDEQIHEEKINISQADKYTVDTMSEENAEDAQGRSKKRTSSIAVMVLMGDAVHNFADGVALGAAFSSSLALGLSTTIAVFCHELPHELGDFAILLASGVSFGRALFLNFLVSLTAMLGLYVGLAISDDETVKQWIVAVAAGLFIYISLVDMMPQLLQRSAHGVRDFILNNIGMLLGAGAMVVLAIFEERISVSV
ncbi:zinc transporter ZIP12-like [Mercenaria mercenaria]|uniref:zinc transporter ZIP12-like n=1 Tax=Mercenaria mercenaria TaxID=6596 RepID=UPI001E1E0D43|nr:zinc transporter ZIP12-like [Mercenaria mercenaria]